MPSETTETTKAEKATTKSTQLCPVLCTCGACVSTSTVVPFVVWMFDSVTWSPPRAETSVVKRKRRCLLMRRQYCSKVYRGSPSKPLVSAPHPRRQVVAFVGQHQVHDLVDLRKSAILLPFEVRGRRLGLRLAA